MLHHHVTSGVLDGRITGVLVTGERWGVVRLAQTPVGVDHTRATEPAAATPRVPPVDGGLLDVEGIELSYGSLRVLFGASIVVPHGGRVALVGTNGAGKTSFLNVIAGLLAPQRGCVRFDGRDITRLSAEDRVRLGITLVAGGRAIFRTLTVEENLRAGGYPFLTDRPRVSARVDEVLDLLPQLRTRLAQRGGTLSGGEQQMVALGRAFVAGPRLLLVDELSLGLAPVVLRAIVPAVIEMIARGTGLLLVEQSLPVALELSDEIHVLEKGCTRRAGSAADLADHTDLAAELLGARGSR